MSKFSFLSTSVFALQKCLYCRNSGASGLLDSACTQCCAGKCAVSFHVTCCVLAGIPLEPSDWPQPVEMFCERHRRVKFKVNQCCVLGNTKRLTVGTPLLRNSRELSTDVFDSRTPTGNSFGIIYCLKERHELKTSFSHVHDFSVKRVNACALNAVPK